MKALGREFSFDYTKRQIRYIPYCLNLVVKAILYSSKKDNIAQLFNTWGDTNFDNKDKKIDITIGEITIGSDPFNDKVDESEEDISSYLEPEVITTKELGKYRKSRPFGKLYNIGLTI